MPIDYSKYPEDWKEIRDRILKRAKNCCEVCGVPNYELIMRGEHDGQRAYQDPTGDVWSEHDRKKLTNLPPGEIGKSSGKAIKIVLTIAHLDHDAENHDVKDDRLMAMCQLHHNRYDAEHRKKNRKKAKEKGQISLFK